MSQLGSTYEEWSMANQLSAASDASDDTGLELAPVDYQALLEELATAQALDRQRTARIHHLEQALDQALVCLDDLQSQMRVQTVLEAQLATTEEFASVQQQAIAQLKRQLAEQQRALDAQVLETQQRDQAIQELLATIEGLTQAQQQELERLKSRIAHDQIEIHTHRTRLGKQLQDLQVALESRQQRMSKLESETLATRTLNVTLQEQLEAAHQQIKELSASLCQYRVNLTQLAQLEQATLSERSHLPQRPESQTTIATLQQDLAQAQRRMEELEEELAQRTVHQTRWQHSQQELETERDHLQTRISTLEQQVAELQEQVLQQAQQAAEQETAVQYWKDRYAGSHRQITHLRDLLDRVLSWQATDEGSHRPLPADLLSALQIAITPETEPLSLPATPLPRLSTVELPEFLVRRRSQQSRE